MILCSRQLRQRWRLLQQRAWQERVEAVEGAIPWRHRSSSMGTRPLRQRRLLLGSTTNAPPQIQPPPLLVDPYQVLQVRRDATRSEIRQAYRKLALWHHPGRASSGRTTSRSRREGARRARLFEMGAAAYETLMDAATRSRCDGLLRDVPAAALLPAGQIHVGAGGSMVPHNNSHTLPDWQVPPRRNRQDSTDTLNSMLLLAATRNEEDNANGRNPAKAVRASLDQYLHRPSLAQVSLTDSEDDDGPEHDDDEETERHDNRGLEEDRSTTAAHDNSLLASMSQGSWDLQVRKGKQRQKKKAHQSRLPPCLLDCGGGSSHDSAATLPALMNSTSTDVHTMVERHFTQGDTDRLFGGPLQLLFRARRWRPFTDPQQVFATVFGSQLFVGHNNNHHHHERPCHEGDDDDEPTADHESGDTDLVSRKDLQHTLAARNNNTARGRGTAVRQADGSLVFTRSRVLHNRRVVRRETVRTDPATGQVSARVTVTSESFDEEAAARACLARQTASLEQEASCCSKGELCLALEEFMPSCTGFSLEGLLCGADTTWLL
jgi:curved DNA-binding protein CbpA